MATNLIVAIREQNPGRTEAELEAEALSRATMLEEHDEQRERALCR